MTATEHTASELRDALARLRVPHNLQEGLQAYVLTGRPVGNYLTAVLENDLLEAVSRGDDASLAGLKPTVQLLYNYTPRNCWGSRDKVSAWIAQGGLAGEA